MPSTSGPISRDDPGDVPPEEDRVAPAPPRVAPSRPVRVVDAGAPLDEVMRTMATWGLRHVPVVAGGRCVGLVRDRDVLIAVAQGRVVDAGNLARGPVPVIEAEQDSITAARTILDGGLDAALVVREGEVVGIVTTTDVVAAVAGRPAAWRQPD